MLIYVNHVTIKGWFLSYLSIIFHFRKYNHSEIICSKNLKVLVVQSCLTLCDARDCSPPASSVQGILQARIAEWVALPPPGDLPNSGIKPISLYVSCIGRCVLYHYCHLEIPSLPILCALRWTMKGF